MNLEQLPTWLWLAIPVVALLFWIIFGPKGAGGGGSFGDAVGNIGVLVILGVIVFVVVVVGAIILDVTGWDDKIQDMLAGKATVATLKKENSPEGCKISTELSHQERAILEKDHEFKHCIYFPVDTKAIELHVPSQNLSYKLASWTVAMNKEAFKGKTVKDFLLFKQDKLMPWVWHFQPNNKAYERAGLVGIDVLFESLPKKPVVRKSTKNYPIIGTCTKTHKEKYDCKKVTLLSNAFYQRKVKKDKCIVFDPSQHITTKRVADGTYNFTTNTFGEVTVSFFDIKKGEKFDDYICT